MAREGERLDADQRVRRRVGRLVANTLLGIALLAALVGWASLGFFTVEPGEAAILLRFGQYVDTASEPGLHWYLPPPIGQRDLVKVESLQREEFGYRVAGEEEPTEQERLEAAMQTSDNNIVHLSFVVQYRIKDAFQARYRVASPQAILRDAAQSAVRGVVGRTAIDAVLSDQRGAVEAEASEVLQEVMDHYQAGLLILGVELQDVQPPPPVREAFDDVLAALQDRNRTVNEAEGYANEVLPAARAESLELLEAARAYRESVIAEADGEASRFRAIAAEYAQAPDVVRTRLFLEAMEEILPEVRTVILGPGTPVLPYLPLDPEALRR